MTNTEPQTTVICSQLTKMWGAACRDCKWIGPEREGHLEARDDQIDHRKSVHKTHKR